MSHAQAQDQFLFLMKPNFSLCTKKEDILVVSAAHLVSMIGPHTVVIWWLVVALDCMTLILDIVELLMTG